MDKEKKQPKRTIILNGTRVWGMACLFLVTNLVTSVWWASKIDSNVTQLKTSITAISEQVTEVKLKVSKVDDKLRELEIAYAAGRSA